MHRAGLVMWLLTPFVLVAVMWATIDTSSGEPRAELIGAPASTAPAPSVTGVGLSAGPSEPELVHPESLDTGFVVVVNDLPKLANNEVPIFLASNRSGWDPGHKDWKLSRRSDMRWVMTVPAHPEGLRMEFKFTRGNWDRVELDADMNQISNRSFEKIDISGLQPGELPVVELEVPHWIDELGPPSLRTGRYRTIEVGGGSLRRLEVSGGGASAMMRDLLVWLPPGYDKPMNQRKRYPVLYLHDGQNLFDTSAGVAQEWEADETATRLIEAGLIEPLIIVGIPHADEGRMVEYAPVPVRDGLEAGGDAYLGFLLDEVMPRVERAFRVKRGASNTGIGGASLGGLIAAHAAGSHPDRFGKLLAESVPTGERFRRYFDSAGLTAPSTIFIGLSEQEYGPDEASRNREAVSVTRSFASGLESSGARVELLVGPGAHDEAAWADRFGEALRFLYPAKRR